MKEVGENVHGYECEFVKPPAKEFSSECPVCLFVLREPHTVTCCGKTFCEVCIGRQRKTNGRCPTCNATEFDSKLDEGLKTSLSCAHVHCSNKSLGCQWVGILGDLDSHLNLSASGRAVGCTFAGVECKYCDKRYQRHFISEYKSNECPKRPYSCSNCQFQDTYDNITKIHWFECQKKTCCCNL